MPALAAVLAAGASTLAAEFAAPTVESVVSRHLRARGGRERLATVSSLLANGRLISGASESNFTLFWARPDRARLVLVTGTRTMIEVVSGERAWWVAPDAEPPQSGLLPLDAAREIAERGDVGGILCRYAERGYTAALAGEHAVDGERVVTVRLSRGTDETHVLSLSTATDLVLRRTSNWGRNGTGVEVEARFSDFRTVDGVVIPFAMERRAGGELLHRIVVERVQLNAPADLSHFTPPPDVASQLRSP